MTAKLHILIVKCYLFTKKIIFCTQISIILMAILMKQNIKHSHYYKMYIACEGSYYIFLNTTAERAGM